jgi:hypothetical protein
MPSAPQIIERTFIGLGIAEKQAFGLTTAVMMNLREGGWHLVSTPVIEDLPSEFDLPGTRARIIGYVDDRVIENVQMIPKHDPGRGAGYLILIRAWLQGLLEPLGIVRPSDDA